MLKIILLFSFLLSQVFAQDFKAEALKAWQNRDDQKSLEEALSKFEKAPQDPETQTYLARGYYIYAEYFMDSEEKKMAAFEKGRKFGERALNQNKAFKELSQKDMEKAIATVSSSEVAPLYWRAVCLGKWAKLNGIFKSLKYKDEIIASIKRVEELKPDFFFASVPRYWGSYYAIAPSIAGGDMEKAKENFQKAMKEAPEYLGTKNLFAELYLVKKDDEQEFKKVLKDVISSDDGPAELVPENRLEKKKAQKLLEKAQDLF